MTSVGSGRGYERARARLRTREKRDSRRVPGVGSVGKPGVLRRPGERAAHVRAEHAGLMIDNTRATFYLYTPVPRTPSLTPPSHQCPSSSSGGMWRARGTRRSAPTRNGARAYRQETHQKTHQKTKLAAIKRFVSPSVADCRLSRGVTKLWERVRKLAARVRSAFVGGAPCVRPPRGFRLPSVRPTPEAKGAHACTRAGRSRERRYARHPPRILKRHSFVVARPRRRF